jgi:hypothetical protein
MKAYVQNLNKYIMAWICNDAMKVADY